MASIRITIGDLDLTPTCAQSLQRGDVIAFADDVCTVVGADYFPGTVRGDERADDVVSLVTESPDGLVFCDYVSPVRIFTVIRQADAVSE